MKDQACAAFFVTATVELYLPRVVATRSQINQGTDPAIHPAPWRTAAEVCRWIEANEPTAKIPQFGNALSVIKEWLEAGASLRERHNDPYVLERATGMSERDELRGRVRGLAVQTRKIYGSFRYGTVASVASIAFERPPDAITAESVRDWCADLCQ